MQRHRARLFPSGTSISNCIAFLLLPHNAAAAASKGEDEAMLDHLDNMEPMATRLCSIAGDTDLDSKFAPRSIFVIL
eukprot:m.19866 g.19866  ORF g.19866 m.19866 type:complete len:77 (-) comp8090_c0_seq2:197-427(-)